MSEKASNIVKPSLLNYLPDFTSETVLEEGTLINNADEAEVSSSADAGFEFDDYSRTFETVKEYAGAWLAHRFDDDLWLDDYRPYLRLEDELTEEETENIGILTDTVIGSALSYLERSPEDLHHVLCKCVLSSKQLNDISEIRYYHYIQYLDLSWNELITIAPLGQLPFLQYLDVSHNYLQELLDFKASFYLTFVNFSHNLVSVIPDLSAFWSITHLNLSNNRIEQITGMQQLRFLSYLDLSYNEIEKLENLNNLRLQFLILHHNAIVDSEEDNTTQFKTLPYIRSIDVSYNHLTSLNTFENTENLERIDVSHNDISMLIEIYYLQNLRYLSRANFDGNPIATMKFYLNVCLSLIKNLMVLDAQQITAEQRIEVKKSCEVDPSFPARETRIDLMLLQQINQPYIGPYIIPYDQPPPMVVMLVGPPGSMKKDIMNLFSQTNENLECGVSHTTRPKLENEVHGKDYYFVTNKEFKALTRKGHFIAVSEFNGHSYGIVHEELSKCMDKILLFHGDINSALSLRIMGINPKLVLTIPRDEKVHTQSLRMKYYYDYVEQGIIRVKNCPECVKAGGSLGLVQESLGTDMQDILDDIIQRVIQSTEEWNNSPEETSLQDMDSRVHFVPQKYMEELDISNSKPTASSILKRRVSEDADDFTQTNDENTSLSEDMQMKDNQKRVSYYLPGTNNDDSGQYKYRSISEAMVGRIQSTSRPLLSILSTMGAIKSQSMYTYYDSDDPDQYKYRSISEAIVGRIQSTSRPLLSILSTIAAVKSQSNYADVSEESSESSNNQNIQMNDFIKKILESRNDLLELHWSNPGIFRETIFTDDVQESLKKLRTLMKFTVDNYKLMKPTTSFDNDTAFKNIVNSRVNKLDLKGMTYLKIKSRGGGQCKC